MNLSQFSNPATISALAAIIRVSSTTDVLASAERLIEHIMAAYSGPNLTSNEIQSKAAHRDDPSRDFSNICRSELESLWQGL
jgi:hypothetical protein